ncbi:MAG: SusC/RagA family TonB-linked outer membrane protein [Pseudobacter sp.]|uniref:SusC/RagA family TonB-linked outer membrane protein n=1 Tax=Pseudobacter sp. TaxID=2045420 RepID=UPI003F81152B
MLAKHIRYCCVSTILLLLLFLMQPAQAQDNIVKGTVTTKTGEPLSGGTVTVKSTGRGTNTDATGKFSLQAKPSDTLVFTFVGYQTREVLVTGKELQIVLEEAATSLNDVVVIGYGSVKKSDLTGSVATVKMDKLKDIPANSVENLLQGRSAGLHITSNSQDPNSGTTVRIRGGSSLRGSNAPLLVVNGFPIGDASNLKQINPADIVSVEILKDASASSIYGSRGANGVMLITTRTAKKGVTMVNLRQQTTISSFGSEIIQWKNPALMAQIDNEAKINGNLTPLYVGAEGATGIYYPSVTEIQSGAWPHFTDWSKITFRDRPVSNMTTFSVNSANEKTSFNLSGNFTNQQGVFVKDGFRKGILSLHLKHAISDKISISSINNFSKDQRINNSNLAYWRNPLWPVFNNDGSYFLNGNMDYDHPVAWTDRRKNETNATDFINSFIGDYQITKELNFKTTLNYKYGAYISDRYDPDLYTENGTNNKGAAYLDNWTENNYAIESYLTYNKKIGQHHRITAMAGTSYQYTQSRTSNLESFNFKNGSLGNENMGSGDPGLNRHFNGKVVTSLMSYMGRVNYTLNDKYLFTLTARTDGSSKFGANNKWAAFPSGAVSWKAHEEDFIRDLNIFDELKFRASYGISGNQGISPYQTLSRYGIENFYSDGRWNTAIGPGFVIGYVGVGGRYKEWGGIPNKDLKWETTSQYNFGLDLAFLNNKLRLTADYYEKRTKDLLRERFLPLSSSYDKIWVNDGEITNKGFEITVDGTMVDTRDWGFSGTFIFSRNRNKVVSLGNAVSAGLSTDHLSGFQYEYFGSGIGSFRETSPNILAVGLPVNVFYGYRVDGILQSAKQGAAAGLTGPEAEAGEYRYLDLNKDGVFNTNDRTIIGDPNPDFLLSLNLSARYKKFDASIFLNGVFGHDVLWSGMDNSAQYAPLRWTPDNPTNDYPKARQGRYYYLNDWFIKDGSFLRIQNVNIGYNFEPKVKWLKNLRLFINAENLYTFTKFEGYDPEVGLDGRYGGGYPRLRKFTFGLDVNF